MSVEKKVARDSIAIEWIARDAVLIGAFQRACDALAGSAVGGMAATLDGTPLVLRRDTPGCAVRVGVGTLRVRLAIVKLDCDETKILNRHVRPLLAAITKSTGNPARYFGRDWIDVKGHPIAHVGFAHERATGAAIVEAFIAVRTPFDTYARASYLGKKPSTLEDVCGKKIDDAIAAAIAKAYGVFDFVSVSVSDSDSDSDSAWSACVDEAIGPVCAGRDASGRMRVGGEWMASSDAVRDLEDRIARGEAIRAAVDAAFTAPHTALFGVRSLDSFARAIELALESE